MTSKKIICPYCKHEYTDDDMYASKNDLYAIAPNEETVTDICPKCQKEILIQGGYIPQYETFKPETDDE